MTVSGFRSASSRTRDIGLKGIHDGRLRITVGMPPDDGKAFRVVVRLVASHLKFAPGQIEIVRGAWSRCRRLRVKGVTLGNARAGLLP